MQLISCLICKCSNMLAWDIFVQLQGWFSSMHTHHAWVLLEKNLSWDFWLMENLGCYRVGGALYRGDGVGGKALPHHRSVSTPSITVG